MPNDLSAAFGQVLRRYRKRKGWSQMRLANALKEATRVGIYQLVKDNRTLSAKIEKLDQSLAELSRMGGWSLDAQLLSYCLDARRIISELRTIDFDGSSIARDRVTELILDILIHAQLTQERLFELGGISAES